MLIDSKSDYITKIPLLSQLFPRTFSMSAIVSIASKRPRIWNWSQICTWRNVFLANSNKNSSMRFKSIQLNAYLTTLIDFRFNQYISIPIIFRFDDSLTLLLNSKMMFTRDEVIFMLFKIFINFKQLLVIIVKILLFLSWMFLVNTFINTISCASMTFDFLLILRIESYYWSSFFLIHTCLFFLKAFVSSCVCQNFFILKYSFFFCDLRLFFIILSFVVVNFVCFRFAVVSTEV